VRGFFDPSWDDVPEYIKRTFDKLGIPEAEKKFLAGVGAQYDSEVVYHNIREDLEKQGVIFLGTDQALKEHPRSSSEYFGTVIPANDNKLAALNTAVWRAEASSTCRRASTSTCRCRPTSASTRRTWASSSGR
jgi:Fe-S cluster assembly scaffold protein SufB